MVESPANASLGLDGAHQADTGSASWKPGERCIVGGVEIGRPKIPRAERHRARATAAVHLELGPAHTWGPGADTADHLPCRNRLSHHHLK